MSFPLCKTFLSMDANKQGIVSILRSDSDTRAAKATSLRRTLSADMSLTQGLMLSPLRKSPSSHEFPVSSSFEEREDDVEAPSQFDVWTSIQQEKKAKEAENRGQFDIWSSIMSQKAKEEASNSSPPYIHPLVKRSASCLSDKSLEICTESLGSETGSEGFSSETGDMEEDKREDQQQLQYQKQEPVAQPMVMPCLNNCDVGKKSPNPSFPPPISSISAKDGGSRRLKTRRDNGRLVIEAVSMPCLNNFLAQRQDGRLVLTFANINSAEEEMEVEELEEEFESFGEKESETDIDEEEEQEEEESDYRRYEIEQAPKLSSGAINVHRSAVLMNKPMWLANRNPSWPKDINEIVEFRDKKAVAPALAQSLPPRPPVVRPIPTSPSQAVTAAGAGAGTVVSFNAYEYYRRRPNQGMSKAATTLDQQSQAMKGKIEGDEFAPLLKGCKEHRRSLFWAPHCIATS